MRHFLLVVCLVLSAWVMLYANKQPGQVIAARSPSWRDMKDIDLVSGEGEQISSEHMGMLQEG